jgi:hypothetical protein
MKRSTQKHIYYNPEEPELDWVYDLYKHWRKQEPTFHNNELLKVFPQAKSIVKNQLKDLHQEFLSLKDYEKKIIDICYRKIDNVLEREKTQEFFLELEINIPRRELEAEIKRLENMLKWANSDTNSQIILDIPKAKSYPIDQLIEFKGNTARCIFHEERTPSMHYYEKSNRVKCFGCGKSGDSIDVVMQLRGCSLSEAVKFINKC